MAAQEGENAPVVTSAFASREVCPGETWKVFLRARDPDGDMNRILCTLEQPAGGVQPAAFIEIRETERRNLSGYIFLNTAGASSLPFAGCRLTVQIQDKKGNLSKPVSFPLSFNPRAVQESPPPRVFQDVDLGPVLISLPSAPGP